MYIRLFYILLFFLLVTKPLFAQTDSLKQVVATLPNDSTKVLSLIRLASSYIRTSPKQGLPYAIEAYNLAQKYKLQRRIPNTLITKGILYESVGSYDSALACYASSMKLLDKLNNKSGVATCYNNIGNIYVTYLKNSKQGLEYYQKALEIYEDLNDEPSQVMIKNNIALVYVEEGRLDDNKQRIDEGIKLLNEALQISRRLKDENEIANVQNSLGDAFKAKKDYLQAVYYYNQSNAGAQKTGDRVLLVVNLNSIGEVYHLQGQYRQAIPFLQQGVAIAKLTGAKDQLESFYRRLATSYESLKDSAKALRYYKLATVYKDSMYNESGSEDLAKMQAMLNDEKQKKEIELLNAQKKTDRIIQYSFLGIILLVMLIAIGGFLTLRNIRKKNNLLQEQNEEINAQKEEITKQKDVLEEQSQSLLKANIEVLRQKDEVEEKGRSLEKANLEINNQKNQLSDTLEDVRLLSKIGQELTASLDFETTFMRLYEFIKETIELDCFRVMIVNESLNLLEDSYCIDRGVRIKPEVITMDDPSRLSVICALEKRDIIIKNYAKEYETYFPNTCLMQSDDIPLSIIYLPLIVDDKVEGVISVQSFPENAFDEFDINLLKNLAAYTAISLDNAQAYMQISAQNKTIEDKNKNITDSLRYAETMQKAMLPSETFLKKVFAEYFVIFLPKDYVSGDFYWCAMLEDRVFAAVVDCTGHGVPGAFMSLIGISLLNEIVKQRNIVSPAAILENLHTGVQSLLRQEDKTNDDGMDVCICSMERLSPVDFIVVFAGAKRPLLYKKRNDLQIQRIKGDNKPIGGWFKGKTGHFTDHELMLRKGDILYLMSDGLVDQDSPEREKFGMEKLTTILESNTKLPMSEQQQIVTQELKEFQRNRLQRDDISMLGIKL
jgi:serine phosphatase RsbU (regulator of sigma subunit)